MIEILKWILKLKEYIDIFIKYIAPRNLEIYTSFTRCRLNADSCDNKTGIALNVRAVRKTHLKLSTMYCVQFKKTRLKLSFISESCLFSKCSERDRRHEKGSIGEKRGGCTEVFNSNTVKEVLPLSQNKL